MATHTPRRCAWCADVPELIIYHDNEWGMPVDDDHRLFEKLCLEVFQCGLSWRTVLNKRDNFRDMFRGFDYRRVAAMTASDVERLLQEPGIIRHRGKIEAVINNAARARELVGEAGSLAEFIWRYEPAPDHSRPPQAVTTSPESVALARALKSRGWRFVGPTTIYAFMQSMGLINDHEMDCLRRGPVEQARRRRHSARG